MDVPRDYRRARRVRRGVWLAAIAATPLILVTLRPAMLDAMAVAGEYGARWIQQPPRAEAPARTETAEPVAIPAEYAEWVLVGTATGLSYAGGARDVGDHSRPGAFTQVYLEPGAYRQFRDHGEFPEGTTFVLEIREPTGGLSIARGGWFAGELRAVHAAIKRAASAGGWTYYDVDDRGRARPMRTASCATCHAEHGAVDNVFVQFYPRLQSRVAAGAEDRSQSSR